MASNHQQHEPKDPNQGDTLKLSRAKIERLRSLLGSLDKKAEKGTCSLVLTSTFFSFSQHASKIVYHNSWVLDSRGSDHMTPFSHSFITYNSCPSSRKITLADDSLTTVAGQRDVILNEHLTLKNVLHVPKLFTNLISIQKLIKDTNCSVIFHSNLWVVGTEQEEDDWALLRLELDFTIL